MPKKMYLLLVSLMLLFAVSPSSGRNTSLPTKKLSAAQKRVKQIHGDVPYWKNEFYTSFKYSRIKGFDYEEGVSRRDPTKPIKVGDTYYVWFTRTRKGCPLPKGPKYADENTPATTWDMASIYYATSKDSWNWEEQGPAVTPGPKSAYDDRSVFTPDIMAYNGKYYLYYQVCSGIYSSDTKHLIGMSWADSPDGPWHRSPMPLLTPGPPGAWDCHKVHDPMLMVRDGKIWLYYKGVPEDRINHGIAWGLAIADKPEVPFIKSEHNPVTNSGHEVFVFPYKNGVLAVLSNDGYEKNTIQFAEDGINFHVKASIDMTPEAGAPFCPDAYANATDARGITWGLCHIPQSPDKPWPFIIRFDCDLSQDHDITFLKNQNHRHYEDAFFSIKDALKPYEKKELMKIYKR